MMTNVESALAHFLAVGFFLVGLGVGLRAVGGAGPYGIFILAARASEYSGRKVFSRAPDATLPLSAGCNVTHPQISLKTGGTFPGHISWMSRLVPQWSDPISYVSQSRKGTKGGSHSKGKWLMPCSIADAASLTSLSASFRMRVLIATPAFLPFGAFGMLAMSAAVPATNGTAAEVPLMRA